MIGRRRFTEITFSDEAYVVKKTSTSNGVLFTDFTPTTLERGLLWSVIEETRSNTMVINIFTSTVMNGGSP